MTNPDPDDLPDREATTKKLRSIPSPDAPLGAPEPDDEPPMPGPAPSPADPQDPDGEPVETVPVVLP